MRVYNKNLRMRRNHCADNWDVAFVLGTIYDLRQCPYETSHWVKSIKFQNHIVRCRRNFPDVAKHMQICDYNQAHHMPTGEHIMEEHLKTCFDYQSFAHSHYSEGRARMQDPAIIPSDGSHLATERKNGQPKKSNNDEIDMLLFTSKDLDGNK